MPAHPLAFSLLCNLRQETLGYRTPLPHLPWLIGCVYEPHTPAVTLWTDVIDTAVGILILVFQASGQPPPWVPIPDNLSFPYISVSLALNSLLTPMIVFWLGLHARKVRIAMGDSGGISGVYDTVITMLVESFALYSMNSVLVIGMLRVVAGDWVIDQPYSAIENASYQILAQTQVRAFQ